MPECKKIRGQKRKVCIADLDKRIKITDRNITTTSALEVDFGEDFTDIGEIWAMVKTVKGYEIFAGVNLKRVVTHHFTIRYRADVDAQTYIFYKNQIFDIIDTENLDEDDEFILLRCALNGSEVKEASFA